MTTTLSMRTTLEEMEQKRTELQNSALTLGLAHPVTVRLSQELDEVFNKHEAIKRESNH
ncbi:aspartyl-phosphate phosphatase Spo0E family protein [Bacillus sp. RO3]|nr:aspartyl-phosphate phosphatase Spo0E family protein [Bacillus sp. RO3]